MTARIVAGCVLVATALSGLLFVPVFGLWPLAMPIAVVVLACYLIFELCQRFPALSPWRPLLALVLGLVNLAEVTLRETTLNGLPTAATVRALVSGATESWRLTLQTTWPVRPEPELLLFVPLVVLVAALLSIELLRWPATAMLPSLVVVGLTQLFTPLTGPIATVAALGYATMAGAVFLASKPGRDSARRQALLVAPAAVLAAAAAVVITTFDQGRQPAYSLHQNYPAPLSTPPAVNPLNEVAARLKQPDEPVFRYTSAEPVDRWRLVVLDEFDGVTWSAGEKYQRFGAELATAVSVPTTQHSARVSVPPEVRPWLPSQAMPASVTGVAPLVDPTSGMLVDPARAGPLNYELTWREPQLDPATLAGAALDPAALGSDAVGVIPPGISELSRTATAGMRPSFQTALVLERYLSENYRVATGEDLPTGHGWPQLSEFLLGTKRGTSEQFAAAYAALARIAGIPARVAVGFHPQQPAAGEVVVRNRDVLAWPEVAVAGIGWVPLDPTGTASDSGAGAAGLASVTAQARAELPAPQDLKEPPLPSESSDASGSGGEFRVPVLPMVLGLLALIVLGTLAIPLLKAIRTWRRRRRSGAHGVAAAVAETRDLLRAHGVVVTPGMTVRDMAAAVPDQSVVDGLLSLARLVDFALWSGHGANQQIVRDAWTAVRAVRRGLARRPWTARIRALFDPRGLRALSSTSTVDAVSVRA